MKSFNLIDQITLNKIKEYCLINKNQESCGFIYKNNNILNIYKCKNIASDAKKYFLINDEDYEKCSFKGDIICCFHSHINDKGFSGEDISNSLSNEISYLMYNIKQDEFYFFDYDKYSYYKKYIGLPYNDRTNDCWSTLSRFYYDQLGLKIPDPEQSRTNFSWDYQLRKVWGESVDLLKVDPTPKTLTELKTYDLLICKDIKDKEPAYGCIYLGNGLILHQAHHKPSKIESIRKGHVKLLAYVGRFNKKLDIQ